MADEKPKIDNKQKKQNQRTVDEIFEAPTILREPTSKQIFLGSKLSLRITATGRPLPSYQWYLNGKKISGANGDRLIVNKVRRDHIGSYSCEVKNFVGKVMSRAAMVSVLADKVPEILIEPIAASIPTGKPFKFRIASPSAEVLKRFKIQWTFNGKRITGANGPELQLSQVKKKYEGEYKVILLVGGEIRSSNCVKLQALPEEGVPDVVPALTKEKTLFLKMPPKEDFFFDPDAEESKEQEGISSSDLQPAEAESAVPGNSEEDLAKLMLEAKKQFLEKLLRHWLQSVSANAKRAA